MSAKVLYPDFTRARGLSASSLARIAQHRKLAALELELSDLRERLRHVVAGELRVHLELDALLIECEVAALQREMGMADVVRIGGRR